MDSAGVNSTYTTNYPMQYQRAVLRSRTEISFEAVSYSDLAQNLETLQFLIGHLSFMLYLHPASLIEPGPGTRLAPRVNV